MTTPILVGRGGDWPFIGHFRGALQGETVHCAWAGCVAATAGPVEGRAAAMVLQQALQGDGAPDFDRRRAIAELWDRLAGAPGTAADLTLVLVTRDADGIAVSGAGLNALYGVDATRRAWDWIVGAHPMLTGPGRPAQRPGALTVDAGPDWLVAVPPGVAGVGGQALADVLERCGVHE